MTVLLWNSIIAAAAGGSTRPWAVTSSNTQTLQLSNIEYYIILAQPPNEVKRIIYPPIGEVGEPIKIKLLFLHIITIYIMCVIPKFNKIVWKINMIDIIIKYIILYGYKTINN